MKYLLPTIIILSLVCTSCAKTDYGNVLVTKVIDGDTLEIAGGERVRLIGIDCPEMYESDKLYRDSQRTGQDKRTIQEMGREAYQFTRKLAEGRNARLGFDVERKDKYGRLLAYVYVKGVTFDRDIFLNREIVKHGYAQAFTIPPNVRYADLFEKLYQEARENKRGLYGLKEGL